MFGETQFLITGGTGFIGRHVVGRLLAQGARVRVFCRRPEKAQRLFGDRVTLARGDLRDRVSVMAAVRDCDMVIHLGATFQFGRRMRRIVEETNVRGTEHVIEAAERSVV
jgi:nucleoside-diphosphate-sugar epimerase